MFARRRGEKNHKAIDRPSYLCKESTWSRRVLRCYGLRRQLYPVASDGRPLHPSQHQPKRQRSDGETTGAPVPGGRSFSTARWCPFAHPPHPLNCPVPVTSSIGSASRHDETRALTTCAQKAGCVLTPTLADLELWRDRWHGAPLIIF